MTYCEMCGTALVSATDADTGAVFLFCPKCGTVEGSFTP